MPICMVNSYKRVGAMHGKSNSLLPGIKYRYKTCVEKSHQSIHEFLASITVPQDTKKIYSEALFFSRLLHLSECWSVLCKCEAIYVDRRVMHHCRIFVNENFRPNRDYNSDYFVVNMYGFGRNLNKCFLHYEALPENSEEQTRKMLENERAQNVQLRKQGRRPEFATLPASKNVEHLPALI